MNVLADLKVISEPVHLNMPGPLFRFITSSQTSLEGPVRQFTALIDNFIHTKCVRAQNSDGQVSTIF